VSNAGAFAIGVGIGFATQIIVTILVATGWFFRRPGRERVLVMIGLIVLPPLIGAIAMPDFKKGLVLWLGSGIGWALSQPVTVPLRHLVRKRD
jgi:hypothetical protein